jgi:hypothetical protein
MSRKNLCQPRLPPVLRHKGEFAYEWPNGPRLSRSILILFVLKRMILSLTLSCLWEELSKTELMPIRIREVKIPLPPGAMLDCGRSQSLGNSGVVKGLDIINAENRTPPPHRPKIRCQGKVDQRVPSLEGTESRLGTPVNQGEAELGVEGDSFGHCSDFTTVHFSKLL